MASTERPSRRLWQGLSIQVLAGPVSAAHEWSLVGQDSVVASAYKSATGQAEVRQWCEARLDGWSLPHEREVVSTALGDTHLLSAGSGETTVLYLPGTNFTAATSRSVVTALAESHRVVVADLPGQPGLSSGERPQGDRMRAYGAWVDGLVAHLSATALVLAGHSLGAAVALSADPSAVAGLVLADPAGLVRLRVSPGLLVDTIPWLLRPTPTRSARLLQRMHAADRRPSTEEAEWMTLVARHTRSTLAPSPLSTSVVGRWREVPHLVLSGERDCFLPVPPLRSAVHEKLGSDLTVIAGAGHLAVDEQPEALVSAVATVRATGRS
jgi:pimeloyl-ACP methyl ester carboxylesterase